MQTSHDRNWIMDHTWWGGGAGSVVGLWVSMIMQVTGDDMWPEDSDTRDRIINLRKENSSIEARKRKVSIASNEPLFPLPWRRLWA